MAAAAGGAGCMPRLPHCLQGCAETAWRSLLPHLTRRRAAGGGGAWSSRQTAGAARQAAGGHAGRGGLGCPAAATPCSNVQPAGCGAGRSSPTARRGWSAGTAGAAARLRCIGCGSTLLFWGTAGACCPAVQEGGGRQAQQGQSARHTLQLSLVQRQRGEAGEARQRRRQAGIREERLLRLQRLQGLKFACFSSSAIAK